MDQQSMQKLRIDRRLLRRRGWLSTEDLERELEALPDVSDKVAPSATPSAGPQPAAGSEGESA